MSNQQASFTEEKMEEMNEILQVAEKTKRPITVTYRPSTMDRIFTGVYRGFDMTQGALTIYSSEDKFTKVIPLIQVVDIVYAEARV